MRTHLYSIYDTKTQDYIGNTNAIVLFKHPAAAVRFFTDLITRKDSDISRFAEDLELHFLGTLEENTITGDSEILITGKAILIQKENAK